MNVINIAVLQASVFLSVSSISTLVAGKNGGLKLGPALVANIRTADSDKYFIVLQH